VWLLQFERVKGVIHKMESVFVCINVELGSDQEVLDKLREIKEVQTAYQLYGVYDIIAKVQAETTSKLKEIVLHKIRKIPKVRTTLTMVIHQTINNKKTTKP
jgi:DNA-binding Lrp family transcriptional regulator